jgi:hypothetical protein
MTKSVGNPEPFSELRPRLQTRRETHNLPPGSQPSPLRATEPHKLCSAAASLDSHTRLLGCPPRPGFTVTITPVLIGLVLKYLWKSGSISPYGRKGMWRHTQPIGTRLFAPMANRIALWLRLSLFLSHAHATLLRVRSVSTRTPELPATDFIYPSVDSRGLDPQLISLFCFVPTNCALNVESEYIPDWDAS